MAAQGLSEALGQHTKPRRAFLNYVINGLSCFFVYDHGVDAIIDRLYEIEKKIDTLSLKEVERPTQGGKDLLEVEDD